MDHFDKAVHTTMSTISVNTDNSAGSEHSENQVQDFFRQLRLNEPGVRQYFEMLEQLGRQQEPPPIWLRTNIHSVTFPYDQD